MLKSALITPSSPAHSSSLQKVPLAPGCPSQLSFFLHTHQTRGCGIGTSLSMTWAPRCTPTPQLHSSGVAQARDSLTWMAPGLSQWSPKTPNPQFLLPRCRRSVLPQIQSNPSLPLGSPSRSRYSIKRPPPVVPACLSKATSVHFPPNTQRGTGRLGLLTWPSRYQGAHAS